MKTLRTARSASLCILLGFMAGCTTTSQQYSVKDQNSKSPYVHNIDGQNTRFSPLSMTNIIAVPKEKMQRFGSDEPAYHTNQIQGLNGTYIP